MKTNQDLLLSMIEQLGGKAMLDSFKREMLPELRRSASDNLDAPVTVAEFQHGTEQIERELPALRQYPLENQTLTHEDN